MAANKRGILNIMESSVWGGMEQYVYDMSEELERQGISPFVLTDIWKPEFISNIVKLQQFSPLRFVKIKVFTQFIKWLL